MIVADLAVQTGPGEEVAGRGRVLLPAYVAVVGGDHTERQGQRTEGDTGLLEAAPLERSGRAAGGREHALRVLDVVGEGVLGDERGPGEADARPLSRGHDGLGGARRGSEFRPLALERRERVGQKRIGRDPIPRPSGRRGSPDDGGLASRGLPGGRHGHHRDRTDGPPGYAQGKPAHRLADRPCTGVFHARLVHGIPS